MRIKFYLILAIILYQTNLYANIYKKNDFNHKYLSNYFSGLLSFDNQEFEKSLKFFNSSKKLINKHNQYFRKYLFALVANNKIAYGINSIKIFKNNEYVNFLKVTFF